MFLNDSVNKLYILYGQHRGILHVFTFSIPRFKQRVSFYVPEFGNLYAVLDSVKVADSLLCVLSPQGGMDDYGEQLLRCLFGQGIPAVTFVTQVSRLVCMHDMSEMTMACIYCKSLVFTLYVYLLFSLTSDKIC